MDPAAMTGGDSPSTPLYRIPIRREFTGPAPNRQRRCVSPPSPTDSGYGSKAAGTPQDIDENKNLAAILCSPLTAYTYDDIYDGPGCSDSDGRTVIAGSISEDDDLFPGASPPLPSKYSTLPKASTATRPSTRTNVSFYLEQPMVKQARASDAVVSWKGAKSSLRQPDRFIPVRDWLTRSSEKFHMTKPTEQMSTTERLLRHERETPDAFFVRPCRNRSLAFAPRSIGVPETYGIVREGFGTALLQITQSEESLDDTTDGHSSDGSVGAVGGAAPEIKDVAIAVDDGRGNFTLRGTNIRFFSADYLHPDTSAEEEAERHQGRMAAAFEVDRAMRVLDFDVAGPPCKTTKKKAPRWDRISPQKSFWDGTQWDNHAKHSSTSRFSALGDAASVRLTVLFADAGTEARATRILPSSPFRILDAPKLRDDYYCSVLAYSPASNTLAVGLESVLYTWSEAAGVDTLDKMFELGHITSVAFSSCNGGKEILAYGTSGKKVSLMALHERRPRIELPHAFPITCVS